MRRWVRVALAAVATVVLVAVALIAYLTSTTSFTERGLAYVGRPGDPVPPPWTRPCRRRKQAEYVLPCGRVQGVVVYREAHDPDGDGEVHGLAVAGRRAVILKSRPGATAIPGVGRRVDVAGTTTRGRLGLTVVDLRRTPLARP